MRLRATVYDPAGTQLGFVDEITQASVERALDGPGTISFSAPALALNARALFKTKYRVKLTLEQYGISRELGTCVIDDAAEKDSGTTWGQEYSGPDILTELKYESTLLGREYAALPAADICPDLVSLVPGWSSLVETEAGAWPFSIRFDGDSVLRALQLLAENGGYHLRLGRNTREVEFGAFGQQQDVLLTTSGQFAPELNPGSVAYIKNISVAKKAEAVATVLYPLGAGQSGDSALTIAESTRSTPYLRQSVTANGRTQWFIEDPVAAERYGRIVKYGSFKTVAPLANTPLLIEYASDALYDLAATWLTRNSIEQESIRVVVVGLGVNVRPGDKVRLLYIGRVPTEWSADYVYREYDGYYWVMSVTERIDAGGTQIELMLSNIDQHEQNEAGTVVGAMEELRVQGVRVQPSFAPLPYGPFQLDIDQTHPVTLDVPVIDDAVFRLGRAILFLKTRPFRSNAKSGNHRHLIAEWLGDQATPAGSVTGGLYEYGRDDNQTVVTTTILALTQGTHDDLYTKGAAGEQQYGIYDDTEYPKDVTITINGNTVAAGLDEDGIGLNLALDVAQFLQPPLAAALRQTHEIRVTCTAGQGAVELILLNWCEFINFKL